jgi:hypothetical protein
LAVDEVQSIAGSFEEVRMDRIEEGRVPQASTSRGRKNVSVHISRLGRSGPQDGGEGGEEVGTEAGRPVKFVALGELRKNLASYMGKIKDDEVLVVTWHGQPMAVMRSLKSVSFAPR